MTKWAYVFLFLLGFSGGISGFAQSVRNISTRDGLPQSFVSGIVQDDSSFIWVGTRNGLARFDGIRFETFQHDPFDSTTIASNIVTWIKKSRSNELWIGYENGEIDVIDPVSHHIRHFIKRDSALPDGITLNVGWLVDADGIFWSIQDGNSIVSYNKEQNKSNYFTAASSGISGTVIKGIGEAGDKGLWIVTQHALNYFDKQSRRCNAWSIPFSQDFGIDASMPASFPVIENSQGQVAWSDGKQLFVFEPGKKNFQAVLLPIPFKTGISNIQAGPRGSIFIEASDRVYQYDANGGMRKVGENFGGVLSFLVDRSGLIWLGVNAKGIRQIDQAVPLFLSAPYRNGFAMDLLRDQFAADLQNLFNYSLASDRSPDYSMRSAYAQNGELVIGLKRTVCRYAPAQKKFAALPVLPGGALISGLSFLSDGSAVVALNDNSIKAYSPSTRRWEDVVDPSLINNSIGKDVLIQDLFADDQALWITTAEDGLLKIERGSGKIIQLKKRTGAHPFPSSQLIGLREDPLNNAILWIGSYEGLIRFEKATLRSELLSVAQGLPDNIVYSILPDNEGHLWITTNKGICRLDARTNQKRVFRTQHGLPGDEFNRFHHLKLPDGRLAFGGPDGWTLFDPLSIKNDEFEPPIAFTGLEINNKEIDGLDKNSILPLPLNAAQQIVLPYNQNTLNIGFAGLEYSQPHEMQYRYMLEGYDNDWVLAGNSRRAYYTKLPPGSYKLIVNTSNNSGKWSKHIKTLDIRIQSPWWSTTLAYICYAIILAGLVWTFMRLRISRLVAVKEVELKERETVQLKELDDMKSRFFSNITHEFRTPLTLITGPAEQLRSINAGDPKQTRLADTIISNSKQLLTLVNRLLDLARLEANALKLTPQPGYPGNAVGSLVFSFEMEADSRNVALVFNDETDQLHCLFYADAVERIVYNLVSNAIKFTDAGGAVTVTLTKNENNLELVVADTGKGIEKEKLPYIFDRFYQAGENKKLAKDETDSGSGIGLAMVKELVKQMDGEIEVESSTETPAGTRFIVGFPWWELPKPTTAEEPAILTELNGKKPQVLVVEDNIELGSFISGILEEKYEVHFARNGKEGLDQALALMPDIVISDVMMPVMDGYEFCGHLKEDIRTAHIPVVMLTAKATQENRIEGLSKGANDYLSKPFHPTELLLRVQNQLDMQQKLRELLHRELSVPGQPAPADPPVQDIFLVRLYELLDDHLDEVEFGVDQLTGQLNMSRSSLHRKLKNLTGLSTTEVVRNYRLKKAAGLLLQGHSSSDAAYRTGFGSPAYFTKCFREVYQLTPGDYIRQYKNA